MLHSASGTGITMLSRFSPYTCCAEMARWRWCSWKTERKETFKIQGLQFEEGSRLSSEIILLIEMFTFKRHVHTAWQSVHRDILVDKTIIHKNDFITWICTDKWLQSRVLTGLAVWFICTISCVVGKAEKCCEMLNTKYATDGNDSPRFVLLL